MMISIINVYHKKEEIFEMITQQQNEALYFFFKL